MLKKIKEKLSLNFIETENVKDSVSSLIETSNKYKEKKELFDESNKKVERLNLKNTYINKNERWLEIGLVTILFSVSLFIGIMVNGVYSNIDNYLVKNNLTVESIHNKALNNFKLSEEGKKSKNIEKDFNKYVEKELKVNDESMDDVLKVTKHQLYVLSTKSFLTKLLTFIFVGGGVMLISVFFIQSWIEPVAHLIRKIRYGKKMDEELMIEKQKANELRLELNEIENEYVRKWESKIGKDVNSIELDDMYIKDLEVDGINFKEILIKESVKRYSDVNLKKDLNNNQNNIEIPFEKIENEIENSLKEVEIYYKDKKQ